MGRQRQFPRRRTVLADRGRPGRGHGQGQHAGPYSPYQGRIYAAFVGYINFDDHRRASPNPTTNTDIFLTYSDDGGRTWSTPVEVNDRPVDRHGYTEANNDPTPHDQVTGRTQFQPAIAVDPATGTLVLSWRDARNDAANTRVATYIATSIDGGQTFSPQTYANPRQDRHRRNHGPDRVLGPQADNQSGGNGQRDTAFGYGNPMGLAVFNGQLYPMWAGNFNRAIINNGAVTGRPLNIYVPADGHRRRTADHQQLHGADPVGRGRPAAQVTISVTFDRPIDPATGQAPATSRSSTTTPPTAMPRSRSR